MSSDEDVPLRALARKSSKLANQTAARIPAPAPADSDDDLTLADLKERVLSKRKKDPSSENKNKKVCKTKRVQKASGGKARPKRDCASERSNSLVTASSSLRGTDKGNLINKLLCRWWYAMDWPPAKDIIEPPEGYEALDGFPGVYICVAGDDIGQLLDSRSPEGCPSFSGFLSRSSEELLQLLELALQNQKQILVGKWGSGTAEEARIAEEVKWLKTIHPAAADKKASKILAKNGLIAA